MKKNEDMDKGFTELSEKIVLTKSEHNEILSNINSGIDQKSTKNISKRNGGFPYKYYLAVGAAILLLVLLVQPSFVSFIGTSEKSLTKEEALIIVKEQLQIGMTEDEVVALFGSTYLEIASAKDDERMWRYDIEPKDGYSYESADDFIDATAMTSGEINMYVFITWGDDNVVSRFGALYLNDEDGRLYHYQVYSDGDETETRELPITSKKDPVSITGNTSRNSTVYEGAEYYEEIYTIYHGFTRPVERSEDGNFLGNPRMVSIGFSDGTEETWEVLIEVVLAWEDSTFIGKFREEDEDIYFDLDSKVAELLFYMFDGYLHLYGYDIEYEGEDIDPENFDYHQFDHPEFSFEQILIDYVGEDVFYEWFHSIELPERTMTNFKKYFDLSDGELNKAFFDYHKNYPNGKPVEG
ncbi:hypothetical protein ACERII_09295 [Evansella sp. AB-rgal1]|uniref:hypothetical protein n=1 Tax=Evansella sp. AB-rgal1 TaxID=3242696 RepID=UPI00359D36E4